MTGRQGMSFGLIDLLTAGRGLALSRLDLISVVDLDDGLSCPSRLLRYMVDRLKEIAAARTAKPKRQIDPDASAVA